MMNRQARILGIALAMHGFGCTETPDDPPQDESTFAALAGSVALLPTSDVAKNSVVGRGDTTNLFRNVDDGTSFAASDNNTTTVATSAGVAWTSYVAGYASSSAPQGVVTDVAVYFRAERGRGTGTAQIQLFDGSTLVASGQIRQLGDLYQNFTDTFSGLNIADAKTLRTKILFHNTSTSGSLLCTQLWIDVKVASAPPPPPAVGGLLPPPDMNFHTRWWDTPGWQPTPDDTAYTEFTPTGDTAADVTAIKNRLGFIPAQNRYLLSNAIKGMDLVLAELDRQGFELARFGYDHENRDETPLEERDTNAHKIDAVRRGSELAHTYGMLFMYDPTYWMVKDIVEGVAPYVDIFKPQNKGAQGQDINLAISRQRDVYRRAKATNPNIVIWHDMAACPDSICNETNDQLLDYYHGLSDYAEGIGIWALGAHESRFVPFLLSVRPPSTPPAGDRSPAIGAATAQPSSSRVGANVAFSATATDPDGDVVTYIWDFGDHSNPGDGKILRRGQNLSHAYTAAGTYTARVTAIDAKGGVARRDVTVTIAP